MIPQKEISIYSEQFGINKEVIDKDWALGHFIAAIYNEPSLNANLIFKGGTCLKKCWFKDYRFSEDLDFTCRAEDFILLDSHLEFICTHVLENAGIRTSIVSLNPLNFQNKLTGYAAIIKFWGADHSKNEAPPPPERWQTKIKIEIILYETVLFKEVQKKVLHPYSDNLALNDTIPCYAIEEVLSEKLRALIQRSYTAPRDYYDIWYLSRNIPDIKWDIVIKAFYQKMEYKGLKFTGVDQLINAKIDRKMKGAWLNSLGHQVSQSVLPSYQNVREELERLFIAIFS